MIIRKKKLAWMTAASIYAMAAGAPVWADDTELLLVNPNSSVQPKPNVLLILDTSGSMDSLEETAKPYDPNQTYNTGLCDPGKLYWTDIDVLPVCAGAGLDTQVIEKSAFKCDAATRRLNGIGNYSNTMVQWRSAPFSIGTVYWWQDLAAGDETSWVECQNDREKHGDGTAGDVYATAYAWFNSSASNAWVSDPSIELSWGSAPRNVEYTVYDGNWLNWKSNPELVNLERLDIVQKVTTTVLNSIENVNVGLMRFNDNDGGPIIHAVSDLEQNRSSLVSKVNALDHQGRTPLSEVLYEAALYWDGLAAEFGERIDQYPTDPNALMSPTGPEIYRSPILDSCAKNYNVLLSDGNPNDNEEERTLVPTLPEFAALTGSAACIGSEDGDCLDEIGLYLKLHDTDPTKPEVQNVTTHTIGFASDIEILKDTAAKSGGRYFLADDVQSLTVALLEIVNDVTDKSLAFSAPAVSVNTFNRTQNLNDIYLSMFGVKNKVHWPGNLKKYTITNRVVVDAAGDPILDPNGNEIISPTITDKRSNDAVNPASGFFEATAQSFWSANVDGNDVVKGGAASRLPSPASRNLFTYNGTDLNLASTGNAIVSTNMGLVAADFGLSGTTGEPTKAQLIDWMRGVDVRDVDNDSNTTETRWATDALGDPLHSQPAAVVYGGTANNPDVVVYTATNDGYLHAVDGDTGDELWSFVPMELLSNMTRLFFDPDSKYKNYGLDGNIVPVVFDENGNGIIDGGNDFVRIIFGMRRGGNTYYALDVTNKNQPKMLWTASPSGLGQSWSTPVVAKIDAPGVSNNKAVVVFGGGYDPTHDTNSHPVVDDSVGASVIMLDLDTGAELWRAAKSAGPGNRSVPGMNRAIPGEVRVIDISGDGFADRMYAADLGGQILRFDIYNGVTGVDFVTGGVIAQLGAEGLSGTPTLQETRRFYTSPDVSLFKSNILSNRFLAISIGSGYRAHPLDNIANDRFYSLRDDKVFTQMTQTEYNTLPVITESNLVDVTGKVRTVLTATEKGWMFRLPPNQKVLSDSLTFDDSVFFVAFSPDVNLSNACAAGAGTNFLYRVKVENGDPVVNNLDTLAPSAADAARQSILKQIGIAPSPVIIFPSADPATCSGAACSPPPIGCVGVECFNPGFVNNPVRTLWTQDGIQ
ncbi:MAG: PilC/PilY family type IV pilus protein [Woeseiaceae bacterium]